MLGTREAIEYTFLLMCALGALLFVVLAEHPIAMGFGLAFYSLFVSVLVGEEQSCYFGYLIYFVHVGTLIVIFCMVVRLAPNPLFKLTPLLRLYFFQTGGRMAEHMLKEDMVVEYCRGKEEWGDTEEVLGFFWSEYRGMWFSGNVYDGLGVYTGVSWGSVLGWLGLVLMLRVVSVANMCKRPYGPLVRFVWKRKGGLGL